jgi:ABC-2 type transport system ATP-binding protein
MPLITVENLVKTFRVAERQAGTWGALRGLARRRYREVKALEGISFTLQPGELVGYIGPNGAGKSTTIKVLAGILVPDSGRCLVDGRVPWQERMAHVARIGVVFGQRSQLWWDLPVIESFELLRDIYRVPQSEYLTTRDELIERLNLTPLLDTPVRQLSLGQRGRCDLAAALLHSPRLLFLDEPTIGLDAVSKLAMREFVRHLNRERGVTVILTTHDMDDIEALCTRIMVIGGGQILSDGTLADLRARVTSKRWLIVDLAEQADGSPTELRLEAIPELVAAGVEVARREGPRVHLRFDPERVSPAELISRLAAHYPVRDLFVQDPPIEEIIARMYAAQPGASALAAEAGP